MKNWNGEYAGTLIWISAYLWRFLIVRPRLWLQCDELSARRWQQLSLKRVYLWEEEKERRQQKHFDSRSYISLCEVQQPSQESFPALLFPLWVTLIWYFSLARRTNGLIWARCCNPLNALCGALPLCECTIHVWYSRSVLMFALRVWMFSLASSWSYKPSWKIPVASEETTCCRSRVLEEQTFKAISHLCIM